MGIDAITEDGVIRLQGISARETGCIQSRVDPEIRRCLLKSPLLVEDVHAVDGSAFDVIQAKALNQEMLQRVRLGAEEWAAGSKVPKERCLLLIALGPFHTEVISGQVSLVSAL